MAAEAENFPVRSRQEQQLRFVTRPSAADRPKRDIGTDKKCRPHPIVDIPYRSLHYAFIRITISCALPGALFLPMNRQNETFPSAPEATLLVIALFVAEFLIGAALHDVQSLSGIDPRDAAGAIVVWETACCSACCFTTSA
jgi:hypothetical protein